MDVLLTWVGARDPGWRNPRTKQVEPGPVLSLLQGRQFDLVYLLFNLYSRVDDFRQRATSVQRACQQYFSSIGIRQKPVDLTSVVDYREIYRVTNHVCQEILREEGQDGREYFVYLSPGTPQMQTVWVLLVQSGLLPARMIDAVPPDLASPGLPRWREVNLSIPDFPHVVNPGETARLIGILQAQNDNLLAERRRLQDQVHLLRAASAKPAGNIIAEGFRLRDYLLAQERKFYGLALHQANGNATEAARLLGVTSAAFRARAVSLGIRQRRRRT